MRQIFAFMLALTFCSTVYARDSKPLKVIAPDLVIESAEQGEFLEDPADPRHFKPSDVVEKNSGLFGWRMKIRTNRRSILIQEKSAENGSGSALAHRVNPKYGYLFGAREIVEGVSPGAYSTTVYVENAPVKTFTWTVK